ncbi:uncharacterized protein LOC141649984 [Silene latifolia]|uniref:uncharacterized protein LOC141649984 n=1 Tax=Silene latifolia TaxID=37657 RepID=UPI003D76B866
MSYKYSYKFSRIESNKELIEILECDDKERFLPLLSAYDDCLTLFLVGRVAKFHAKNCLLALIQGEGCESVLELYARTAPNNPQIPTPLASVTSTFHQAYDIIDLLLNRGTLDYANIKCNVHPRDVFNLCPLDRLLFHLSRLPHLLPWNHCSSINKLIILLCQWDTKSRLDCARLLVPHTRGLNDIAWTYVMDGNLAALGGLLLVAGEKVLVPIDTGILFSSKFRSSTIRYRIMDMMRELSSNGDLDDDGLVYQSMLISACKLFDIFDKAGDALRLYCSSIHEHV